MPITQDRFLAVIDAAAQILNTQRNIITLSKDNANVISRANSVVDHTNDEYARSIIQELLGIVHSMGEMVEQDHRTHLDLAATVLSEQNYFRRVKRSNERAAYYQRQKRNLIRDGHGYVYNEVPVPQTVSSNIKQSQTQIPMEQNEDFKKWQEEMHRNWPKQNTEETTNPPPNNTSERSELRHPQEANAPERSEERSPQDSGASGGELTLKPKEHKDGVIRYLPTDEELNAPESFSDKAIL